MKRFCIGFSFVLLGVTILYAPVVEGPVVEDRAALEESRTAKEAEIETKEREAEKKARERAEKTEEIEGFEESRRLLEEQRMSREQSILEGSGLKSGDPAARTQLLSDSNYNSLETRINDLDIQLGDVQTERIQIQLDMMEIQSQMSSLNADLDVINAQLNTPEWVKQGNAIVTRVKNIVLDLKQTVNDFANALHTRFVSFGESLTSVSRSIAGKLTFERLTLSDSVSQKDTNVSDISSQLRKSLDGVPDGVRAEFVRMSDGDIQSLQSIQTTFWATVADRVSEAEGTLDAAGVERLEGKRTTVEDIRDQAEQNGSTEFSEKVKQMNDLVDQLVSAKVERNAAQKQVNDLASAQGSLPSIILKSLDIGLYDAISTFSNSIVEGGSEGLGSRLKQWRLEQLQKFTDAVEAIDPAELDAEGRTMLRDQLQTVQDSLSPTVRKVSRMRESFYQEGNIVQSSMQGDSPRTIYDKLLDGYEANLESAVDLTLSFEGEGKRTITGDERMFYALEFYGIAEAKPFESRTLDDIDTMFEGLTQERIDSALDAVSEGVQSGSLERQMAWYLRTETDRTIYKEFLKRAVRLREQALIPDVIDWNTYLKEAEVDMPPEIEQAWTDFIDGFVEERSYMTLDYVAENYMQLLQYEGALKSVAATPQRGGSDGTLSEKIEALQ